VAAGLIDSFLGNVLQAVLLVALLVFGSTSLDLDLDLSIPQPGNGALLLAAIVLVALAVAAYLARPLLRRLAARVRALVPDARAALQPLRDGRKLAQLVGGNLAAELLFACALMLFVRAFGVEIGLVEVLFVNMSASLLVSVVPIPGGIGVAEASLILGLTRAGVDEETAFAAAVSYRLATFYMPPAWGFLAFRWLGRKGYV
jgi:uncharacterized membrane protein YbhN (UPF0104 family)